MEARGPGRYYATNDDPKLKVTPPAGVPTGNVRVDMRVSTDIEYPYAPQLFWTAGPRWSGADSVRLPAPTAGRLKATIGIPADARRLRLDVGDEPGEFQVEAFRLRRESAIVRAAAGLRGRRHLTTQQLLGPRDDGTLEDATGRMPELDLYASADNLSRAREVSASPRFAAGSAAPTTRGVSVVVLTLEKPELIVPLLDRLEAEQRAFEARGLRLQVLIGDTGSTNPEVLERYASLGADFVLETGLAYHFSRCNNTVVEQASCDTLLFLNNDVIFPDDRHPVLEMYDVLHADDRNGVVGACLYFEDGRAQHLGIDFLRDAGRRGLPHHPKRKKRADVETLPSSWQVPAVTGACLMIHRDLYLAVDGMDEGYDAECQDIAMCLAAHRLGYACQVVNAGPVLHLENATRPVYEKHWPDRQRFLRHWGSYIEAVFL
ncbi:MAG: hypothetical protein ACJ71Z_11025 [Aeromicrobium sp.]